MTEREIKDMEINRTVVQMWTPEEYAREQRIMKESADRFIEARTPTSSCRKAPQEFDDAIRIATEHEIYDQMYGSSYTAEVNMVEVRASGSEAESQTR
jgi:hypothetical protein